MFHAKPRKFIGNARKTIGNPTRGSFSQPVGGATCPASSPCPPHESILLLPRPIWPPAAESLRNNAKATARATGPTQRRGCRDPWGADRFMWLESCGSCSVHYEWSVQVHHELSRRVTNESWLSTVSAAWLWRPGMNWPWLCLQGDDQWLVQESTGWL